MRFLHRLRHNDDCGVIRRQKTVIKLRCSLRNLPSAEKRAGPLGTGLHRSWPAAARTTPPTEPDQRLLGGRRHWFSRQRRSRRLRQRSNDSGLEPG